MEMYWAYNFLPLYIYIYIYLNGSEGSEGSEALNVRHCRLFGA